MPVNPFPVYKEELLLGTEQHLLPILFSGTVILCEPKFSNFFIGAFAGWLIPLVDLPGIGDASSGWRRVWVNQKQFVNFSIPYFPSTYQLAFKPGWFLRGRPFELNIWEVT